VMAGCRPLWLLSGGQAPESDSPTVERIRQINPPISHPNNYLHDHSNKKGVPL